MISIIVPVYKTEQTLPRCIESLIAQTWLDKEILLVDDGSPDNAGVLCDCYAQKYSYIKVIHKKNGGLSSARNAGVKAAKGEFYLFVDSDDYLAPNACERFVEEQRRNNADMVICGFIHVYPNHEDACAYGNHCYHNMQELQKDYTELSIRFCYANACNKMYRAELFVDGFDETCFFGEDVEFNVRYIPRCHTVAIINDCLYYYTHGSEETITGRYDPYKFDHALHMYELRRKFATQYFTSDYIPLSENAVLAGDTVRAIQYLLLKTNWSAKQYYRQINLWLQHPLVKQAAQQMYRGNIIYFVVWLAIRFRLSLVLQIGFTVQKNLYKLKHGRRNL